MPEDKVQTLHPSPGKSNKKIDRTKYDIIKAAILEILKTTEPTHNELFETLNKKLNGKFEGNINWYGETVKLELEARRLIERTNDKPQKYKIK
jgi:hypothetical protein